MILCRGLPSFGRDLLGCDDCFLRFVLQYASRPRTSLFDEQGGLGVRPRYHFLPQRLGPIQFGLDLIGVLQTQSDLASPFLQHCEHLPVGKLIEQRANDAETDNLRSQMRPVDAESLCDLSQLSVAAL